MSLRPIKSRKARHQIHAHLKGRTREEWRPFQAWNWNSAKKKGFELLGKKSFVLLLIGLVVTIGFAAMYADPNNSLFHSYVNGLSSNQHDPIAPLWFDSFPSATGGGTSCLNGWKCSLDPSTPDICFFATGIPTNIVSLNTNKSFTATCISQQQMDLSTAADKVLEIDQALLIGGTLVTGKTSEVIWMFLTTNQTTRQGNERFSTTPVCSGFTYYVPECDPTVAFAIAITYSYTTPNLSLTIKVFERTGTEALQASDAGCAQGSVIFCATQTSSSGYSNIADITTQLNYTSSAYQTSNSIARINWNANTTTSKFMRPSLNLNDRYYWALAQEPLPVGSCGIAVMCLTPQFFASYSSPTNSISAGNPWNSLLAAVYTPNPPAQLPPPYVDGGGIFGPVIKALISIGIFILNGVFAFIAFAGPAINSAIQFLETLWVIILNAIGNILGFGNVGNDLQTLLGNIINFFTQQVPVIFTNTGALFARFFDVNSVYFSWLPTALNIAVTIATLAINGITFVLTIIDFSFRLVGGVYLIILLSLFLVYTGDDALGGILGFLETTQWLILGPLGWLCKILNFALDIVTYLVGLIPKPFIQMVAHSIPRIPIIETSARFVNPSFDLAAIRNGNMLAVWAWFVDFTFLAWYNGVTPALPGSLGFLLPGMPATTFAALRGFLPMLEICLIVVSALAFIIWPVNKMFSMISLDLDVLDFDMSPGRKISQTGLGAVRVKIGKKRLQGRLSKKLEKRKQEKIEKETRRVLGEGGAEKIREEGKRLKEELERTKRQAELQKERNQ